MTVHDSSKIHKFYFSNMTFHVMNHVPRQSPDLPYEI